MNWALTAVEFYCRCVFAAAWIQMGWVDWTQQKIRNHYLRLWLKLVALGYAVLAAQTALGFCGLASTYLTGSYFLALGGYVLFSALAAYVLWALRIWPAGDVKLYVLLALYYPLMRIPGSFRSGLRFLEVLINVFIPAAVFLFLRACSHLWRTRFTHQAEFLRRLGGRKLLAFALEKSGEASRALRRELAQWVETYRDPKRLAFDAAVWLSSMAVMSLISYYLNAEITSNVMKTIVCFALFFGWTRFCSAIGSGRALALTLLLFAALLARHRHVDWAALGAVFGHISVFSLFIFFGIQLAFKIVAGQAGFAFLPLLFILPSLIPWARLGAALGRLPGLGGGLGSWTPGFSLPPEFAGLPVWAGMGLFFGLSLVFVRIWDAESYQSVSPKHIVPYMNLGPSIVSRLQEDPEFFEEHFDTLYADGLTPAQAERLKEWCLSHSVDLVPLAPTISFANWIFFGYFLTLMIDGHVLKLIY